MVSLPTFGSLALIGAKAAAAYAAKMEAVAEALRGLFAKYEGVCSVEEAS